MDVKVGDKIKIHNKKEIKRDYRGKTKKVVEVHDNYVVVDNLLFRAIVLHDDYEEANNEHA